MLDEENFLEKSLEEKENLSLQLSQKQIKNYNKIVVASSWGKDSIVTTHIVKRVCNKLDKDFDILWNNTYVHYPSVYKIKEKLEKEWNLDIVEAKPYKTFWEIVEEYGWPGIKSSDRSDKANNSCCYYIKKKPTKVAIKENKWDLYFDGLTAYESDRRYMNMKEYGQVYNHKSFGLRKVHPVGWWTVDDIWDYIEKYHIPYPNVYDNEIDNYTKRGYSEYKQGHRFDRAIRNGCWSCSLAIKHVPEKMKQLRTYYPKLWRTLMEKGLADEIAKRKLDGQGKLDFDNKGNYFDEDTREHWLDRAPCFFDKL